MASTSIKNTSVFRVTGCRYSIQSNASSRVRPNPFTPTGLDSRFPHRFISRFVSPTERRAILSGAGSQPFIADPKPTAWTKLGPRTRKWVATRNPRLAHRLRSASYRVAGCRLPQPTTARRQPPPTRSVFPSPDLAPSDLPHYGSFLIGSAYPGHNP